MNHDDTVELLKECNAGIKMGVTAIEEVLDKVTDKEFLKLLSDGLEEHRRLGDDTHRMLAQYHDSGKEPGPLAKGMSWLKTNVMISMDESDGTIADLITDGCNMGVKTLYRYLNQYERAEESAKEIAKKLIHIEEQLAADIRGYL